MNKFYRDRSVYLSHNYLLVLFFHRNKFMQSFLSKRELEAINIAHKLRRVRFNATR